MAGPSSRNRAFVSSFTGRTTLLIRLYDLTICTLLTQGLQSELNGHFGSDIGDDVVDATLWILPAAVPIEQAVQAT
jgi:hypothetical protein